MFLGIRSVIRELFPDAVLWHADNRRECLRILKRERVSLMIADGTIDSGPNLGMIREVRVLQPDTKIVMLQEDTITGHHGSIYRDGEIDLSLGKSMPVERICKSLQQVLSGTAV